MSPNMSLPQVAVLSLGALLLVACSCGAYTVSISPPPTATPIVIVVTATFTPTPLAPTPTSTSTSAPTPTHTPLPATNTPPPPTHTPTSTPPTPTPTPPPPAHTLTPTPPPFDFVVVHQRMWTNEENGGASVDGSVVGCGYGHQIYVWVMDAAGNPLDGVVIGDTYNNPKHISGEKGPGHAQYDLYMNGYQLMVVEDTSTGRPVTSETSQVMSNNDWEIPIPWLIEGHYCATEEECLARRVDPNGGNANGLCWGHYSFEITFQRTW